MPETLPAPVQPSPCIPQTALVSVAEASVPLCWRIHLLKRDPARLPVLLLAYGLGAGCVWLMFGTLLPVLAALLLLLGSVSEYLFPITYRLTDEGIRQEALTSRIELAWKDVRRCRTGANALLLTSLAEPSPLDAFRGILLRFAPEGETGDRASLLVAIAAHAPHIASQLAAATSVIAESVAQTDDDTLCDGLQEHSATENMQA